MIFLTQPYLLSLNPTNEMNIVWIQRAKTAAKVEFGATQMLGKEMQAQCYEITGLRAPHEDGKYGETPEEHEHVSVWQYIARLDGLRAGEEVYYRCVGGEEQTKIYSFHTAPEKGSKFRFAQLSDLQGLPDCHLAVHKSGCHHPDFILYSGDAPYTAWRLDHWFDTGEMWQDEDTKKKAFFPCMQQENGARLMQYAPLFFCPGNHELDDMRCLTDKDFGLVGENWSWSIFMQIFRPLYPDTNTSLTGRRWYSADYADMHIVSLSINRWSTRMPEEYPGWRLFDSIDPQSEQIKWLSRDLATDNSKYKWVIQHFHILNRGGDVQFNLCDPVIDENGKATYPHDHGGMLMDLFSENHVNAVSFGHSHVYERYFYKGTHYIEAAYLSICFRGDQDPPHPIGLLPTVEDNSQRSFLIVECCERGLVGRGYYAEGEGVLFDEYVIADQHGNSVCN